MGLFNMRERAALLGGTCTIRRRGASGGTVVWAELPLLSIAPDDAGAVHSERTSENESERER